jgi:hypothetical protein
MVSFVIKSAICLTILYGFYHLFLWNIKAFNFNRFYLLFSLLFAFIIPLITIRVKLNVSAHPQINRISHVSGEITKGFETITEPTQYLTFHETLIILYCIITCILFFRFALNIYKIIKLVRTSPKVSTFNTQIVLIKKQALPYSFFRYIFVNRSDYQLGKIEKELIIHEQTHCLQYHSVDILLIEMIKIVLWFNPFVWLFRKAIQLNHEYLADSNVLSNHDLKNYQNILINLVFRNNSTYLASNFNYSLTKKRLIMMTRNNSLRKAIFRKVAAISVFLILAISLAFSQEIKQSDTVSTLKYQNEWWYPILKKHNIVLRNFNTYTDIFEMGTKISSDGKTEIFGDAFIIIKENDKYLILKSPKASHIMKKKIIECDEVIAKTYKLKSDNIEPLSEKKFKKSWIQIKDEKVKWTFEEVKS